MRDSQGSTEGRSKRRRLGQVFTPRPVADWMAAWACAESPRRILDPALGTGVFIHAIDSFVTRFPTPAPPQVDAFEVDESVLTDFRRPGRLRVDVRREDFVTAHVAERYDAIIANPPYIRHHALRYDENVMRGFDALCGRRLSRMTNLYALFLIKIWTLLAPRGRAAVILPAEWLNADFGQSLKAYLLQQNALDAIVHFDSAATVFSGVLTTAAIVLLRRGRRVTEPVRLVSIGGSDELGVVDAGFGRCLEREALNPAGKWTPLFRGRPTLEAPRSNRDGRGRRGSQQPWLWPEGTGHVVLGDLARCSRGIATGANRYFTLRESDRLRYGIDREDLALCITKAQDLPGDCLGEGDLERLIAADRRVYLLSPREELTEAVQRYLAEGERLGMPLRYLPSHRPVWYRPERREPAPILVLVFARERFRFIHNRAGVLNLTAFHSLYPRDRTPGGVEAMVSYLNGPEAQEALRDHRRVYADGLFKLEPRDVEAIPMPEALRIRCGTG